MKRIHLRFESFNGFIFSFAVLSVMLGFGAYFTFSIGEIALGIFVVIVIALMATGLLFALFDIGVVIDFEHNRLKMKTDTDKCVCDLDKVKNLDIIFRWEEKMKCYSADIKAFLKNGKTIAVKNYPHRSHVVRGGWTWRGKVSERNKRKIERQVSGYDFITCRTEK